MTCCSWINFWDELLFVIERFGLNLNEIKLISYFNECPSVVCSHNWYKRLHDFLRRLWEVFDIDIFPIRCEVHLNAGKKKLQKNQCKEFTKYIYRAKNQIHHRVIEISNNSYKIYEIEQPCENLLFTKSTANMINN